MSKPRQQTPSRPARQTLQSSLLQSATWLGWEMTAPAAVPSSTPRDAASASAPKSSSVISRLGLPVGSEPA